MASTVSGRATRREPGGDIGVVALVYPLNACERGRSVLEVLEELQHDTVNA